MTTEARRWPLDVESLAKGDVIPPEIVESYGRTSRADTKAYKFKLLGLRQQLTRQLAEIHGQLWVIKSEGDGLRILTDSEAVDYTNGEFNKGRRVMVRNHARAINVDVSALSAEQRATHDRNLTVQSAQLTALSQARKALRAKPHARSTPPRMEHGT